jgi:hypothetical protein
VVDVLGPDDTCGKEMGDTIEKELKETRCVIVLWSQNSVESFGCTKKLRMPDADVFSFLF